MRFYSIIKRKALSRRWILSALLAFVGIIMIIMSANDMGKCINGTVELEKLKGEDRYLKEHEGEYVTITIVDMQGYVNGYDGEISGTKYGMIPTKKSGWIVGYTGCVQYCQLISCGRYNDVLEENYKSLIDYDSGKVDKPDLNIKVKGRIVKRTGVWKDYFESYARELVEMGSYGSIEEVKRAYGGEYMIDMSQSMPLTGIVMFTLGFIFIVVALFIIMSFYLKKENGAVNEYLKRMGMSYKSKYIIDDYNDGYELGSTVIGSHFIYYVKGINVRLVRICDVDQMYRKKKGNFAKVIMVDIEGNNHSFWVNAKYSKKIIKRIFDVLQEMEEFGYDE